MPLTRVCVAAAAACLFAAPAMAQDYGPYGYGGGGYGFDWDGFYSGVYGGGEPFNGPSWDGGIFTGVNVSVGSILMGAEAQVGVDIDENYSLDALVMARGGMTFGSALAYATAGGGLIEGGLGYAVGGGVEYGFTDYLSARGDLLGLAQGGGMPDEFRLTAGLAFHL